MILFFPEGLCNMPPEPGQLGCLASNLAYYYEAVSGECQSFIYSGCGGNANNFNSYEKCMNYCNGKFTLNEIKILKQPID